MRGVLWRVLSLSIEGRVRRLAVPWLVASVFTLTASSAHAQEAPAAPVAVGEEAPAAAPSATTPEAGPGAAPTVSPTPANPPPSPRPSPSNEAPSPPPAAWRLQLSLTGAHSWGEATVGSSSAGTWEDYGSRLSGTLFLGKVVDDVAGPRSLLPFLQRTTEVAAFIQAAGGSFATSYVRRRQGDTFTAASGGASVFGYVLPALRLGARASFEQVGLSRLVEPRRFVDVGASVGLRSDDNLLSLSYDHTVAILGGEAMPARLGALSLREYVLVDRSVGLGISGTLLDRGASAEAGVTVYPIPDLAIEGGLHAGRAAYAITDWRSVTTRVGGGGGAGFWIARVLRISAGYGATFEIIEENASELTHAVNVGLAVRL